MPSCSDYFSRALNSENPASALGSICALDRGSGVSALSERFGLPHHATPGGPPDRTCVGAAWAALAGGRTGTPMSGTGVSEARSHLAAHRRALGIGEENENRSEEPRAPVESRAATLGEVDFPQRTIDVLAVPYEQEGVVEYRGEIWTESFERGAFAGLEKRPERIKAFRDHEPGAHNRGTSKSGLVGKVTAFDPDREEGLLGTVQIAKTALGDETLQLADEGILGVSIGFAVRGSDQVLNRATHQRRIRRAFVDHLAFPDEGAYPGAGVIGVRRAVPKAEDLPKLETPNLDEVVAWLESRRK